MSHKYLKCKKTFMLHKKTFILSKNKQALNFLDPTSPKHDLALRGPLQGSNCNFSTYKVPKEMTNYMIIHFGKKC